MPFKPAKAAADLQVIMPAPQSAFGLAEARSCYMDEDAFRIFYERTSRPLFTYLFRVSGKSDLAEDLLQEAYCRLLSVDLRAMDEAQTKSYLFKIANNLLRDQWRREKRKAFAAAIDDHQHEHSAETKVTLRLAFEQLKARERQLLWLAYVEGSSHKEIAEFTGLRSGSIRLLLFRARKKLANMLRSPGGAIQKVKL